MEPAAPALQQPQPGEQTRLWIMNKDGAEAFLPLPRLSCLNTNCWSELRLLKSMFGARGWKRLQCFCIIPGKNRWFCWIQKTSVLGVNFGCCQSPGGVKGCIEIAGEWGRIAKSISSARESAALALTSTSNLQIVQICFSQFT